MKRRDFVKGVALLPATGALLSTTSLVPGAAVSAAQAQTSSGVASGGPAKVPDFAEYLLTSDMEGLGPDGKRRHRRRLQLDRFRFCRHQRRIQHRDFLSLSPASGC